MGLGSSPPAMGGRSKSGILVGFGPQIAPPWPNLTISGLPGSYTGSQDGENERAQRLYQICRLLARWEQDRVRIGRQDDQSLGFW